MKTFIKFCMGLGKPKYDIVWYCLDLVNASDSYLIKQVVAGS